METEVEQLRQKLKVVTNIAQLLLEKREALAKALLAIAISEYLNTGKDEAEFEDQTATILIFYYHGVRVESYCLDSGLLGLAPEGSSESFDACLIGSRSLVEDTYERLKTAGVNISHTLEELEARWHSGPVSSRELALQIKLETDSELTREEDLLLFARVYQLSKVLHAPEGTGHNREN
jgi:hypothetical protein